MESWDNIRKYIGQDLEYEKVVFRHLEFERTDSIMIKLEAFLTEVIGTKYGLNPLDLVITKDDDVAGQNGDDRTFFCSQLVAQCLKQLELINNNSSSSKFLPVHFS